MLEQTRSKLAAALVLTLLMMVDAGCGRGGGGGGGRIGGGGGLLPSGPGLDLGSGSGPLSGDNGPIGSGGIFGGGNGPIGSKGILGGGNDGPLLPDPRTGLIINGDSGLGGSQIASTPRVTQPVLPSLGTKSFSGGIFENSSLLGGMDCGPTG